MAGSIVSGGISGADRRRRSVANIDQGQLMRILISLLLLIASSSAAGAAPAEGLLARWIQMAPGGMSELRVVMEGTSCPAAVVDGANVPMQVRAAPYDKFPVLLCALTLKPDAVHVSVLGETLQTPKPAPERILVLGDTGCRIKGATVQACNDPAAWPFPQVAAQAAKLKPDLVIHVGDYLYRESACPGSDSRCAGSPSGDNWATWAADFFTPAKPLLEAAPWVIVRGNHEDCVRSGAGFLRLLGPLAVVEGAACVEHVAPYAVSLGAIDLVVTDNANAVDCCDGLMGLLCTPACTAPHKLVDVYRDDFASLPRLVSKPSWIVGHHPIWGVIETGRGMVGGGNVSLMDAEQSTGLPANIDLMLSGHIHTFEAINYAGGLPPQLIVGEGGDRLDSAPLDLSGRTVGTAKIDNGFSLPGWGFTLLTHVGDHWTADVFDSAGAHKRTCTIAARRISC
jgi:Calcineurin-like phosphoesterase